MDYRWLVYFASAKVFIGGLFFFCVSLGMRKEELAGLVYYLRGKKYFDRWRHPFITWHGMLFFGLVAMVLAIVLVVFYS